MSDEFLKKLGRVRDAGQRLDAMMRGVEPGLAAWWRAVGSILGNMQEALNDLEVENLNPETAKLRAEVERLERRAIEAWGQQQEKVIQFREEAAHMRQVIDEELRCLNHLRDELAGRIDGEAGKKFFPVIGRAMDRLNEARDYRG